MYLVPDLVCGYFNAQFKITAQKSWTLRSAHASQTAHYMCQVCQQQACQRAEHPQAAPRCLIAARHCRRPSQIPLFLDSTAFVSQRCPCPLPMPTGLQCAALMLRCATACFCTTATTEPPGGHNPACARRRRHRCLTTCIELFRQDCPRHLGTLPQHLER